MGRIYTHEDLSGNTYNKLKVIKEVGKKGKQYLWECICDCGNTAVVTGHGLKSGNTKSCGCLHKESSRKTCLDRNYKHGMSTRGNTSKEYRAWANIKQRTTNPNRKDFDRYGAIGREMSENLFNSFEAFLDEIGMAPNDGQKWSVERIDNTKGYIEGNIKWETEDKQQRNRRKQKNNTTGVGGVFTKYCRGILHYVAGWNDLEGKRHTKMFSTKKYGVEIALSLAVKQREDMIAELNARGAGYSDNHGK